jgi:hypothetical protein
MALFQAVGAASMQAGAALPALLATLQRQPA